MSLDLLRLCFPSPRTLAWGRSGPSVGKSLSYVSRLVGVAERERNTYMAVCDFDSISGYKRSDGTLFRDPRGYFFFLDFDLKDQPPGTTAERLEMSLNTVFKDTATALVFTGGGYHVYYCCLESIRSREDDRCGRWHESFRNALKTHSLVVDKRAGRAVTDIVRVPGSWNEKHNVRGNVVWMRDSAWPLDTLQGHLNTVLAALRGAPVTPAAPSPLAPELSTPGLWPEGAPKSRRPSQPAARIEPLIDYNALTPQEVGEHCAAYRAFTVAIDNGFEGGTLGDRNDVLMYSVLTSHLDVEPEPRQYVVNQLLHWPGSTRQWLETEYDGVVPSHSAQPWGCDKWSDHFSPACQSCSYANQPNMNPLKATRTAQRIQEALANGQALPGLSLPLELPDIEPFFVGRDLKLFHRAPGKPDRSGTVTEDKLTLVCEPAFSMPYHRKGSAGSNAGYVIRTPTCAAHEVGADALNNAAERSRALSAVGVFAFDPVKTGEYLHLLAKVSPARKTWQSFGWHADDSAGRVTFVGPGYALSTGDVEEEADLEPAARQVISGGSVTPVGSVEGYYEALSVYDEARFLPYQFYILSALATPLYHAVAKQPGPTLALVGEPNDGKSTCLFAANAVWFPPRMTAVSGIDTGNGMLGSFEALRHLPVTMNETSHVQDEVLHRMVFGATEGQNRRGLTQSQALKQRKDWATLLMLTSNHSLVDIVARQGRGNRAAAARALEVRSPAKATELDVLEKINHMNRQLRVNHGLAGKEFAAYLLSGGLAEISRYFSRTLDRYNELFPETDRFVKVHCALVMSAAVWSVRQKRDTYFTIESMQDWCKRFIQSHDSDARRATLACSVTVEDVIGGYTGRRVPLAVKEARRVLDVIPTQARNHYINPHEMLWFDEDYYYFSENLIAMHLARVRATVDKPTVLKMWAKMGAEPMVVRPRRIHMSDTAEDGREETRANCLRVVRPDSDPPE